MTWSNGRDTQWNASRRPKQHIYGGSCRVARRLTTAAATGIHPTKPCTKHPLSLHPAALNSGVIQTAPSCLIIVKAGRRIEDRVPTLGEVEYSSPDRTKQPQTAQDHRLSSKDHRHKSFRAVQSEPGPYSRTSSLVKSPHCQLCPFRFSG